MAPKKDSPYQLTLSLNALNHLGINLYSNTAAVIAETVANAWDADAENVRISLDGKNGTITIEDDGHGMSLADANEKFLTVGYARRERGEQLTPKYKRPVMGRKGIGKLSLFSVARIIGVQTTKGGKAHGFRLVLDKIEKAIRKGGDKAYKPEPLPKDQVSISRGTRLVLSDLKKELVNVGPGLTKRIARRFSVIGDKYHFHVYVDGHQITIEDRDYFHKIEYLWRYGSDSKKYAEWCVNCEVDEARDFVVSVAPQWTVSGWIGSVKKAGDLKDGDENINKITVIVRGKLAHEDILEEFNEGGVYSKYLIGELNADFLDIDTEPDIATSSRQRIIEDDARYIALKSFAGKELKHIQSRWTELRNKEGEKKALEIPEVDEWFKTLSAGQKELAGRLFGKLNQLPLDDDPEARRTLYKQSIIAFQSLSYKERLGELDHFNVTDIALVGRVLGELNELEAAKYYQVIKERLEVIRALHEKLKENALEKVVQQHLFTHLWLLDPSWERATDALPSMEETVGKAFDGVFASLTEDERKARLDIRYKTAAGKHIIVELKRPKRVCSTIELYGQIQKYREALTKCLRAAGNKNPYIEVVCVVGEPLSDWSNAAGEETSEKTLDVFNARVVMYQQLIDNAEKAYAKYLELNKSDSALAKIIEGIDTGAIFQLK